MQHDCIYLPLINSNTQCQEFINIITTNQMKIGIVSKELIKPSSPTPLHFKDFKLSFIDERIPHSYIPLILYYSFNEDKNTNQSEISHQLKNSLSNTLVQFYPLAGRIKGQSSIDCNDNGILYIETYANSKISDIIKSPKAEILDNLIPYKSNGNISSAEELLAIQISFFACGGISIGICISHRVADVCTLSSFLKSWASICYDDDQSNVVLPIYNSASIFPPRNTPDFKPNYKSLSVQPPVIKLDTKRFVFSASAINDLKLNVLKNSSIEKPTRVEVVSAFLWKSCVLAKGLDEYNMSVAFHPVNLRGRFNELKEYSFGNLFQMTSAVNIGQMTQISWIELVKKLRGAFVKIDSGYIKKLSGEKGFEIAKENFKEIGKLLALENVEVFRFSSYCRFPIYEADFGWGNPVWVSSGSFGSKDCVFLFDSVQAPGGIEAWVVMADKDMERLQQDVELQNFTSLCPLIEK